MFTFFHGWRRKAGWIAFAMTILLVIAWKRSQSYSDSLVSPSSPTRYGMISSEAGLEFFGAEFPTAEAGSKWMQSGWNSDRIRKSWDGRVLDINSSIAIGENLWVSERFGFCRFENRTGDEEDPRRVKAVIIPYWSVIVPTALLSACLILWKPRKRLSGTSQS
jgi:hypothetical protein